jgi:hypothetical protein
MTPDKETLDLEFERLKLATEPLRASPGFIERVLSGIESVRAPGWDENVVRFGRAMLVVAALSAVAATVVGVRSQRAEAEAFASTYGMEDVDW